MTDDRVTLEARVAELEWRMDQVLSPLASLPGDTPIERDDAHVEESGGEPKAARQAVLEALGRS